MGRFGLVLLDPDLSPLNCAALLNKFQTWEANGPIACCTETLCVDPGVRWLPIHVVRSFVGAGLPGHSPATSTATFGAAASGPERNRQYLRCSPQLSMDSPSEMGFGGRHVLQARVSLAISSTAYLTAEILMNPHRDYGPLARRD